MSGCEGDIVLIRELLKDFWMQMKTLPPVHSSLFDSSRRIFVKISLPNFNNPLQFTHFQPTVYGQFQACNILARVGWGGSHRDY